MASPIVVESIAVNTITNSGTTCAVTLPSGIVAGDLLIIAFAVRDNASSAVISGWTNEVRYNIGSASSIVFSRIADGSEGATATITSLPNGATRAGVAYRITGYDAANPVDTATGAASTQNYSASRASQPAKGLIISVFSKFDASHDATYTYGAGDSDFDTDLDVNSGTDFQAGVTRNQLDTSTTATTTVAHAMAGGTTNDYYVVAAFVSVNPEVLSEVYAKVGGVWKNVDPLSVRDAGVWKEPVEGHVRDAGVWKDVYG